MKVKRLIFIVIMLFGGMLNAQEILIFGGDNNKEFLGCLTCNEMAGNSVYNNMSTYGWGNDFGKWNPFGKFKNSFSTYSACNEFSQNGPVLVDRSGQFYGRLTVNEFVSGSVCGASASNEICTSLKAMCANQ